MDEDRTLVIGHRGAPGHRPEHTASAYRLACELGVDAVEPDVVVTRDGVLVVRHENEISETTDVAERPEFAGRRTAKTVDGKRLTGWFVEDFDWEELATLRCRERLGDLRPESRSYDDTEPILRLIDVLRIVDEQSLRRQGGESMRVPSPEPGRDPETERPLAAGRDGSTRIGVVVEIKHAQYFSELGFDMAELLLAELAAAGWEDRPQRLTIECFEMGVLDALRGAEVRASLVFLMEREGAPADEVAARGADARSFAWFRSDAGLRSLVGRVSGISVAKSDLMVRDDTGSAMGPSDLADRAHALGLTVFTWTLRPENRFLNRRFRSSADPAEWGDWRGEFGLILSAGVDGIFVDHPELGLAALLPKTGRA